MLGTYFTFVLLLFILLLTGGILAYSGDLKNTIKTPLLKWEPALVAKYCLVIFNQLLHLILSL